MIKAGFFNPALKKTFKNTCNYNGDSAECKKNLTRGAWRSILRPMKILNRYFLRQLVMIFIMLLMVLTGLAWMVQIMSMMKFLISYGVEFGNFLGLTVLMVPFIVSIIIPFVTFIAVIAVYNKMISENEITVMAASTLSPGQIARPAMWLAIAMTIIHFVLNIWIVPATQAKFYDTQWNLRYGLAHMKLQESAFTEMAHGLVVYVDNVSGHDLSQVMLSDTRDEKNPKTIFAEKGKLVSTARGLSIVMTNGSLMAAGNTTTVGTFENFDMDLNVADRAGGNSFRVRRVPTYELWRGVFDAPNRKQHRAILTELCSRTYGPIMNIILAALCATILLRSSLLRRRASFAPAVAVAAMAVVMAAFMSASNMLTSFTDFVILGGAIGLLLIVILVALYRK